MKRRPRSENRRVLRKLEATTIGSRVFPFRSPPTSMPSVGARRSTRVFVPKASAAKARPSRSSLPQSRTDGDDNDWLPLAWWKPEEGKRRISGVGVAGWNKPAVMPAEPTPVPAAAAAAAPEPGNPRLVYRRSRKRKLVLKELKKLDRPRSTEINYVYSRKRRRSQMEASTSSSASKGNFKGLFYVRRPQKKLKLDPLVEPLAVVVPVETGVEDRELEDATMQLAITEFGGLQDREQEDEVMQLAIIESGRVEDREQEEASMHLTLKESMSVEDREQEDAAMQLTLTESGRVEDREHKDEVMQLAIMESGRVEDREQEDAVMQLAITDSGRVEDREQEDAAMQLALMESGWVEDREKEEALMQLALTESVSVEDREQGEAAMQLALTESGRVEDREQVDAVMQLALTELRRVEDREHEDAMLQLTLKESGSVEDSENEYAAMQLVITESGWVEHREHEDAAMQLAITESGRDFGEKVASILESDICTGSDGLMLAEPSGHGRVDCREIVVEERDHVDAATQLVIMESACVSEGSLSSVLNEQPQQCPECVSYGNLSSVPNEPLAHAMLAEPSGNGEMACKETVVNDRGQEDATTELVITESACFSECNLSCGPNEPLVHAMLVEQSGIGEMACKETEVGDRGHDDAATELVITELACFSEGNLSSVPNEPSAHAMLVEPSGHGEMSCKETVEDDMGQEDAATQLVIMESAENFMEMVVDVSEGNLCTVVDEPLSLDMLVKRSGNDGEAACRETVAENSGHENATMQLVVPESVRNFAEVVGISEGDLCTSPDESLALAVLVEPSCHGGVDRFASILGSVVRWMRRPRAALWSLTTFLFSESLVGVFALHGIHFLPLQLSNIDISPRKAVSGCGLCKIYNAGQSVPLVSIEFSTLPLFFKDLHIALALGSFYLSGVLIRYLMDTSRFEEERYAIVPVESHVVTSSFTPVASIEVTSFSDPVVASNEVSSFSDPVVASNEVVSLGSVESSNELVTVADAPELVVQNMAIAHSSNLQKHPKKKRKMRSRVDRKVAVSLQASCPALQNFMEPIRVKPVDAWVGDMAREDDDTTSPCGPLKSRKFEGTREMKSALAEIKQNIDSARCNVNILVTVTDRCWRVEGAELMLEFSESREWCIAVKVQDIIRYLHKPQEWRPCAVNRLNHTYMWGWEDGWKLEFFDKWDWYVFKELHAECRERNALGVPVKIIPVPGVQEVSDYDDVISSSFTRPDMYICMASDEIERAVASEHASYDMDSGDEEWLKQLSEDNSPVHIPADVFEKIIFALETNAYNNPHDIPDKERAVDLCQDLGGRDIVACLYDYWLKKRNTSSSSLVKVFQVPPLTGTQFLQKPHLRKKRSLTRQRSQARRGKPDFYLQAGAEQEARRRVHEAEIAANRATEVAIQQRNRAQVLMQNAELAAYKSAMAFRIAEAKRVSESPHIASVILD